MSNTQNMALYHRDAAIVGIAYSDAETLRRCANTLHRWSEQECGDSNDYTSWCIVRDDDGKTYREVHPNQGKSYRTRIADRETPALKRAQKIADQYGLTLEYQGDPRGWPLTLKTKEGRDISPPVRS